VPIRGSRTEVYRLSQTLRVNEFDFPKALSGGKHHCLAPPPPYPTSTPSCRGHGVFLFITQESRYAIRSKHFIS
jgi:hypothetical protein